MGLLDTLSDSLAQEMAGLEDQRILEIAMNNPVTLMHIRHGKYLAYQDFENYPDMPKNIIERTIDLYNYYVKLGVSKYAIVGININDPSGLSIDVQLFRSEEDGFTNTITVENVNDRNDTYTLNVEDIIFKTYLHNDLRRNNNTERKILLHGCSNDEDIFDETYEAEDLDFDDETIKDIFLTEDKHLKTSIRTRLKELQF